MWCCGLRSEQAVTLSLVTTSAGIPAVELLATLRSRWMPVHALALNPDLVASLCYLVAPLNA